MISQIRRTLLKSLSIAALSAMLLTPATAADKPLELVLDHVMLPVYFNNAFVDMMEGVWRERQVGKVQTGEQNANFKAVYYVSKSFYVEYLSTVQSQPYWSNAIYLVVPKKYWSYYKNPALVNEHFLIPEFGSGYQLVSPDFPHLNRKVAKDVEYDGLTVLISKALEQKILNIGGVKWKLPATGTIKVHDKLHHVHEIGVIDDKQKLVAPLFEANPVLREFL